MLRTLVADFESALSGARFSDLAPRSSREEGGAALDTAAFSQWLPYGAYLEDRQVFVNRDSLSFCLKLRPQSGADEEMARVLTALYAASPKGTGIQLNLLASPAIRDPLARYAAAIMYRHLTYLQLELGGPEQQIKITPLIQTPSDTV